MQPQPQPIFDLVDFTVAIVAATLAFAFFLAGEILMRAYQRYIRHHNALCEIEDILWRQNNAVLTNKKRVANIRELAHGGSRFGILPLHLPEFGDDIGSDLLDLRIKNDVAELRYDVVGCNEQRRFLGVKYEYIEPLLEKDNTIPVFQREAPEIAKAYEKLSQDESEYIERATRMWSKVRLLLRARKSVASRVVGWCVRVVMASKPVELTEESIDAEIDRLEGELKESKADGHKEPEGP